jgi:hypothetical protein
MFFGLPQGRPRPKCWPYRFGEVRVATLALLIFTALSGWISRIVAPSSKLVSHHERLPGLLVVGAPLANDIDAPKMIANYRFTPSLTASGIVAFKNSSTYAHIDRE